MVLKKKYGDVLSKYQSLSDKLSDNRSSEADWAHSPRVLELEQCLAAECALNEQLTAQLKAANKEKGKCVTPGTSRLALTAVTHYVMPQMRWSMISGTS